MSTTPSTKGPADLAEPAVEKMERRTPIILWSSFAFVVLQSICTALVAASGLRTAIGAGALVLSSTSFLARFHQSEIRDPMLLLGVIGAVLDLAILWQVRRLRSRPASQWRQQPPSPRRLRMERVQLWFSALTLLLVASEMVAHKHLHGTFL